MYIQEKIRFIGLLKIHSCILNYTYIPENKTSFDFGLKLRGLKRQSLETEFQSGKKFLGKK